MHDNETDQELIGVGKTEIVNERDVVGSKETTQVLAPAILKSIRKQWQRGPNGKGIERKKSEGRTDKGEMEDKQTSAGQSAKR